MRTLSCLFVFFLSICPIANAQIKLPDLGDPDAATLTLTEETTLGQALWQKINLSGAVEEESILSEYLQGLGHRLSGQASIAPMTYTFFLVKDASINAFALPGGYIGINEGLLLATKNEDELASVVAHEIAHVRGRHIARMIHYSDNVGVTSLLGILAGAVVSAANPLVGSSILTSAMASGQQSLINFTRQQEKEADNVGLQIMQKAGFNPKAMAHFFATLLRHNRHHENPAVEYLRTHPLTESRIVSAEQRAALFTDEYRFKKSIEFEVAQQILIARGFTSPRQAIAHFSAKVKKAPDDIPSRCALAHAYLESGKATEALSVLDRYDDPEHDLSPFPYLIKGQALMNAQQGSAAVTLLQQLHDRWPRQVSVNLTLAKAQLSQSDPKAAIQLLIPLMKQRPENPLIPLTLSQAFAADTNYLQAHLAQAEYQYLKGFLSDALLQLEQAKRWAKEQPAIQEQIEKREQSIKRTIALQSQMGLL
ncbi:MAG: hypothetical protein CMF48_01605 [Legionellales bacterium]|nr:hypothetical protein [Legionellales bacterium]|tara:strand:+ start:1046 stop:2488 length:1443 start_codon:yes stop_codon:yes gene_type:complete